MLSKRLREHSSVRDGIEAFFVPYGRIMALDRDTVKTLLQTPYPLIVQSGPIDYKVMYRQRLYDCNMDIRRVIVVWLLLVKIHLGGLLHMGDASRYDISQLLCDLTRFHCTTSSSSSKLQPDVPHTEYTLKKQRDAAEQGGYLVAKTPRQQAQAKEIRRAFNFAKVSKAMDFTETTQHRSFDFFNLGSVQTKRSSDQQSSAEKSQGRRRRRRVGRTTGTVVVDDDDDDDDEIDKYKINVEQLISSNRFYGSMAERLQRLMGYGCKYLDHSGDIADAVDSKIGKKAKKHEK